MTTREIASREPMRLEDPERPGWVRWTRAKTRGPLARPSDIPGVIFDRLALDAGERGVFPTDQHARAALREVASWRWRAIDRAGNRLL